MILRRAHASFKRLNSVAEKVIINVEVVSFTLPDSLSASLSDDALVRFCLVRNKKAVMSSENIRVKKSSSGKFYIEKHASLSISTTLYYSSNGECQEKMGQLVIQLVKSNDDTDGESYETIADTTLPLHAVVDSQPQLDFQGNMRILALEGTAIGGQCEVFLTYRSISSGDGSGALMSPSPSSMPDLFIEGDEYKSMPDEFEDNSSPRSRKLRPPDVLQLHRSLWLSKQNCFDLSMQVVSQEESASALAQQLNKTKQENSLLREICDESRINLEDMDRKLKMLLVSSVVRVVKVSNKLKEKNAELDNLSAVLSQKSLDYDTLTSLVTLKEMELIQTEGREVILKAEIETLQRDVATRMKEKETIQIELDSFKSQSPKPAEVRFLWNRDLVAERDDLERKSTQQSRLISDLQQQVKDLKDEVASHSKLLEGMISGVVTSKQKNNNNQSSLVFKEFGEGTQISSLVRQLDLTETRANKLAERNAALTAEKIALNGKVENQSRELSSLQCRLEDVTRELELEKTKSLGTTSRMEAETQARLDAEATNTALTTQ
eukprot:gene13502-28646_t